MNYQFEKATRTRSKAKIAISGPSGAGKTYTALVAAKALAHGGKVAVIDTERGSASLYSDKFQFDVLELDYFNPDVYVKAIHAAEDAGFDVIVIDSLSHAWEGEGGILETHNTKTKQSRSGNSYTAWADVTPMHQKLIDTILQSKCHMIITMRSKMEYIQEKDSAGKTIIRKVGLSPVQRPGIEYEFTMIADLDVDHNVSISKTRIDIYDGKTGHKPDERWFRPLAEWLEEGKELPKVTEVAEQLGAVVTQEEPEEAAEVVVSDNPPEFVLDDMPMSYETAYEETSSKNIKYGEIATDQLANMANTITKAMKKDMTVEEREEKSRKLDAIRTLLKYRAEMNKG